MKLAAAYVRVSTEEQAMRGYSIEAQRDALRKYAKENGYKIVAEYSDEGVSGKKPYNKRPALSQFMSDIQNRMDYVMGKRKPLIHLDCGSSVADRLVSCQKGGENGLLGAI